MRSNSWGGHDNIVRAAPVLLCTRHPMDLRKLTSFMLVLACCLFARAREVPLVNLEKQHWAHIGDKRLTLDQVKQCILAGGIRCRTPWMGQFTPDGSLELSTIMKGKYQIKVRVICTTDDFSIFYKDSTDLDYSKTAEGEFIHPNYNMWIQELANAITIEIVSLLTSNPSNTFPETDVPAAPPQPTIKLDRVYVLISSEELVLGDLQDIGKAIVERLRSHNIVAEFHAEDLMDLDDEEIVTKSIKEMGANYILRLLVGASEKASPGFTMGMGRRLSYTLRIKSLKDPSVRREMPLDLTGTPSAAVVGAKTMQLFAFYNLF